MATETGKKKKLLTAIVISPLALRKLSAREASN